VSLEAVGNGAAVCAVVAFQAVGDSVFIQNIAQLGSVGPQTVLIAHLNRNGTIWHRLSIY
jgi:hypothetical protein